MKSCRKAPPPERYNIQYAAFVYISSSGIVRVMEQRPLDSATLELCISSSGIAREMEQRPFDSSTLELCISSSGIAREMEQRPLDSSTLELYISSSGIAREMEQRPLDRTLTCVPPPLQARAKGLLWKGKAMERKRATMLHIPTLNDSANKAKTIIDGAHVSQPS